MAGAAGADEIACACGRWTPAQCFPISHISKLRPQDRHHLDRILGLQGQDDVAAVHHSDKGVGVLDPDDVGDDGHIQLGGR